MFDFHIHLARLPQKRQLTQLLLDKNYDFVAIACEPWEWDEVNMLKMEFSTEIKPFKVSYGLHPMIATQVTDKTLADLQKDEAAVERVFLEVNKCIKGLL